MKVLYGDHNFRGVANETLLYVGMKCFTKLVSNLKPLTLKLKLVLVCFCHINCAQILSHKWTAVHDKSKAAQ